MIENALAFKYIDPNLSYFLLQKSINKKVRSRNILNFEMNFITYATAYF